MGDRTPTCCPVCNGHGVLDQLTCETICDNCEGCGIVDLDLDKLDPYGLGVGGLDKVSAAALLGAWHDFLEAEHVDRCVSPLDFDALMRAALVPSCGVVCWTSPPTCEVRRERRSLSADPG